MGRKIIRGYGWVVSGLLFILVACSTRVSPGMEADLRELEMEDVLSQSTGQEKISEIKDFIQKEQNVALKIINASSNRSRFYRMLGLQYMNLDMFGEAYQAFSEARLISPTNALLAYYQAVAAANVAKNMPTGSSEKIRYREIARDGYQIALNLKPDFKEALYGSAIFYAYELGDLVMGLSYINRLVTLSAKDERAWIIKGNIHVAKGEKEVALFAYQEAYKQASSSQIKEEVSSLIENISR